MNTTSSAQTVFFYGFLHKQLRYGWEVTAYMVLRVVVLTRALCVHADKKMPGYSFAWGSPGFYD